MSLLPLWIVACGILLACSVGELLRACDRHLQQKDAPLPLSYSSASAFASASASASAIACAFAHTEGAVGEERTGVHCLSHAWRSPLPRGRITPTRAHQRKRGEAKQHNETTGAEVECTDQGTVGTRSAMGRANRRWSVYRRFHLRWAASAHLIRRLSACASPQPHPITAPLLTSPRPHSKHRPPPRPCAVSLCLRIVFRLYARHVLERGSSTWSLSLSVIPMHIHPP